MDKITKTSKTLKKMSKRASNRGALKNMGTNDAGISKCIGSKPQPRLAPTINNNAAAMNDQRDATNGWRQATPIATTKSLMSTNCSRNDDLYFNVNNKENKTGGQPPTKRHRVAGSLTLGSMPKPTNDTTGPTNQAKTTISAQPTDSLL